MHLVLRRTILGLCTFLSLLTVRPLAAAEKPNVLFIAIDDLNDWVGCLNNHPQILTPNIDALAARGTLFTNAHTQAPLCNPSRSSLLTGLRPSTTGIYSLQPGIRDVVATKNVVSLPQHFQKSGYFTATSGKVFHEGSVNIKGEFEVAVTKEGGKKPPKRIAPAQTGEAGKVGGMDWGPWPVDEKDAIDWKVADGAIENLGKAPKDKPFFVACGFHLPHVPCYAPQKWFDLYPDDKLEMPLVKMDDRADVPPFSWYLHWKLPEPRLSWLQKNNQWRPLVRAYLASTSFMDSQVGRVIEALQKTGRADNTIICLWSDHGWHLGEKGISGKNTLWERSTHVPFLFAGPGVQKGLRCGRPVELLDIYPTLIDLCGLPPREGLEGHTLMPQLKDPEAPRPWPAITTHNQNNHSVRTERWRYIHYADGSEELYDRNWDPNEWTNLAKDPQYASVKEELAKWLPKVNAPAVPGSNARLLEMKDGKWYWENKPINPADFED